VLNFTWKAVVHQRQGSKVEGTTLAKPVFVVHCWDCLRNQLQVLPGFQARVAKLRKQISLIRIKKSPFLGLRKIKARLALLQQATENSKEVKDTTV
jgi:hypothetical protein